MTDEKILYTDGHDVTVTDFRFQVRRREYKVNGITKCAMMTLQPARAPGMILLLLGAVLAVCGLLNLITPDVMQNVQIGDRYVNANTLAIWTGGALAVIAILVLGLVRERYAVRIATAEGEKDALVSTKKEYISQIVDALNQAATYVRTKAGSRYFTMKNA